jgi:hypothetical protein
MKRKWHTDFAADGTLGAASTRSGGPEAEWTWPHSPLAQMLCTTPRLSYVGDVDSGAILVALPDSGLTVRVLVREGERSIEVWDADTKGWKYGEPEILAQVPPLGCSGVSV